MSGFFAKARDKLTGALLGSSGRQHGESRRQRMQAVLDAEDDTTPPRTPINNSMRGNSSFDSALASYHEGSTIPAHSGLSASGIGQPPGSFTGAASGALGSCTSSGGSFAFDGSVRGSPGARSSPGFAKAQRGGNRTPTKSTEMSVHDAAIMDTLAQENVDLAELRKLCWGGCPHDVRLECWMLLSGYSPTDHSARDSVMARKRSEYASYVQSGYANVDWDAVISERNGGAGLLVDATVGAEDVAILKQIRKDIPRTAHSYPFLDIERGHLLLERLIFIWAKRHPACGYVQGMLDIILPFCFVVFAGCIDGLKRVSQLLALKEADVQEFLAKHIRGEEVWMRMEADIFWLSSRLLGNLQENFTFDQSGAHAMVKKLETLVRSIHPQLAAHIVDEHGITFPEFAFRWMNCMLLRELTPIQGLRLYDTYMSEESRFADLHVYVCATLLERWAPTMLKETEYTGLMHFLQKPPTFYLQERDMDEIISQAYLHQQIFESAPRHLQQRAAPAS